MPARPSEDLERENQQLRDALAELRALADDLVDWYCLDHTANGRPFSAAVVDDWRQRIRRAGHPGDVPRYNPGQVERSNDDDT